MVPINSMSVTYLGLVVIDPLYVHFYVRFYVYFGPPPAVLFFLTNITQSPLFSLDGLGNLILSTYINHYHLYIHYSHHHPRHPHHLVVVVVSVLHHLLQHNISLE